MKKAQYLSFTLITLLVFIFTSCSGEEDLKIAEPTKKIYLPSEITYTDDKNEIITVKFTYDSLNRLESFVGRSPENYVVLSSGLYSYNEKGRVNKYFGYTTTTHIYYDENGKIKEFTYEGLSDVIKYNYNQTANSYKSTNIDHSIYLDQNDDLIRRNIAGNIADIEYTSIKGVFADLEKQPYFNFLTTNMDITQNMSTKAIKSITYTTSKIIYEYVLNELGYPVEVTLSNQDGEFFRQYNYTYTEITVN
ncbi:hypothetical protein UMM65_14505 [Aureibaculum sp. 2210JD6-5]|uniref:hypothetical protein n=1 Tax=Aureibaculum sp. 2210JD6-5 TaxID=3103957 RepID=UPI002AAEE0A3|nr:hypothetical protein [Aureibaculum sp. 2210JD6-5]MDY7396459.1 hypothetical protein [Aureibaculum sp. 2210JD6-5]